MKLEHAIVAAANIHQDQVDKGGEPYILHPLRVMAAVRTPEERLVAVLHDTVEDAQLGPGQTGWDVLESALGYALDGRNQPATIPARIRAALDAITRRDNGDEPWDAYIARVAADPIARAVKIADLTDNTNLARIPRPSTADLKRTTRYRLTLAALLAG